MMNTNHLICHENFTEIHKNIKDDWRKSYHLMKIVHCGPIEAQIFVCY